MNHQDHVRLLRKGVPTQGGTWADLGAGTGAFTLALADLLGPKAQIYAVDQNARALREQELSCVTAFRRPMYITSLPTLRAR